MLRGIIYHVDIFFQYSLNFFNGDGSYGIFTDFVYSSWVDLGHSLDVFYHLICFAFEEIYHVSQCSHDLLFTSAYTVLELDVVPRFSGMMFVFVNLFEVWVVIPKAVPAAVVSEGVVLSVPGAEIFSFSLISRFHCAVESAVSLSGCNVVDVYVRDLIYSGVYEFTTVVSPIPHNLRLS